MIEAATRHRIGYIGGEPVRVNERIIDGQWIQYLGEYTELVKIPSFSFFKLFGGTIENWIKGFPDSLMDLSKRLADLCERYQIRTLYLNLPVIMPYLLMARSSSGLDLGFLFLAHSVGSEFWIRKWIGCAPWLSERDVLLCSTESSKQALLRISDNYRLAHLIPLSIAMGDFDIPGSESVNRQGKHLLAIGRIEDVKNIHVLLKGFKTICSKVPNVRLSIAGEYTGQSDHQKQQYKHLLETMVNELELHNQVVFVGAVEGEVKEELFRRADLLVNLSTDPGETFGYNLVEAKVWGLPVVCTNWDGFREVVLHGEDGFLVDCHWEQQVPRIQIDQFIDYTVQLLLDKRKRQQFSRRAVEAAQHYNYKRITPLIVSAVEESSRKSVCTQLNTDELATSTPSDLLQIYHTENLKQFSFHSQSLLTIMSDTSSESLSEWMHLVKPVIQHFANKI
ncbi:glycosyltransferase [Paenibacillus sp. SI8]|uniref:glycosyltransferase n=1 Tax=unclassified Paenibacillus TaxID=185978 RepID=UPI00346535E3